MRHKYYFLLIAFFAIQQVSGQDYSQPVPQDTVKVIKHSRAPERRWGDGGVGLGLDYGGILGIKATFYPISYMGIFAAVGWENVGIGYNAGILGRLLPANGTRSVRPYLKVMYGVNGATKVTGKNGYDKMFYGITTGIGLEIRFGRAKKGGINFDLNVPFRSPQFFDTIDQLEHDKSLTMKTSVIPITVSLGYNVEF